MIYLKVFYESTILALNELWSNKLRTFLSLLGICIGIFCIIAVQSAVDSLATSIKDGFGEFGSDVVIVDVWPWDEDPGDNYWKYLKRPSPSENDFEQLSDRLKLAKELAFALYTGSKGAKYKSNSVEGTFVLGTTPSYASIQNMEVVKGRSFTLGEYQSGANKVVLGSTVANELFKSEDPINKDIKFFGSKFQVIGVLKEEGENPFNFLDYDEATWIPFNTSKKYINTKNRGRDAAGRMLYIQAKEGVELDALKDEVIGKLRSIRKLKPTEENNFAVNDISILNEVLDSVFGVMNIAGLIIGLFALIVGMFSVANIMFVSVKERTSIIGVKKALGAKRFIILLEFLIESIILCVIGGVIGILLVMLVLKGISMVIPFDMWLSINNLILGVSVSVFVGIVAGVIPAFQAARMDPVDAIRS